MKRIKIDYGPAAADPASGGADLSAAAAVADFVRQDIPIRAKSNIRLELKPVSIERGSSMQHIMIEAINEFLVMNGRRPIA